MQVGVFLMWYNWMPFRGAILANRPRGFWFPCSPQHRLWASAAAGLCLPCSQAGILPCSPALSLITCRIRSVPFQAPAQLLWRAVSSLLSARLVDNAAHEVVEHGALPPQGLWVFPLSLSGWFFFTPFCQENCFLEENSLFLIQLQVVNYLRLTISNWF